MFQFTNHYNYYYKHNIYVKNLNYANCDLLLFLYDS